MTKTMIGLMVAALVTSVACSPGGSNGAVPAVEHTQVVDAHFTFRIPPTWEDGRFTVERAEGDAAAGHLPQAENALHFSYVSREAGHAHSMLLILGSMSEADWNVVATGPDASKVVEIARSRGEVLGAMIGGENPFPAGSADAKSFDAMHLDAQGVKSAIAAR